MKSIRRASVLGILALACGVVTCLNPNERLIARAKRLALLTEPAGAVVGTPFAVQPVVELRDEAGYRVTQANVEVTATLVEGVGSLLGTTKVKSVDGVATFGDLAVDTPGPHTIAFSAADVTETSTASFAVALPPGEVLVATSLSMVRQPSASAQIGLPLPIQPIVRVLDQGGNAIATAGITVTATISSGGGTLAGSAQAITDDAGIATFSDLAISGDVGTRTLSFDAPSLTGVASNAIAIVAGTPSALSLTVQPSASAQNGVPLAQQPVVQLRDSTGNAVPQAGIVVTATIASGSGAVSGNATATTNASGVASFAGLSLIGSPGSLTLSLSAPGIAAVVTDAVALAVGPPAKVVITTQPSNAVQSGDPFAQQPVVQLADAGDNFVAQGGVTVAASIASGGGTLGGAPSAVTAADGRATFTNLSIAGLVGTRTLRFSGSALSPDISDPVTVSAGAATQIVLITQPGGAVSGVPFTSQPVIEIRDTWNNRVTSSTASVSVAIATGTGSLGGTTTVDAVNGQARFTDVSITGSGGFTLTFTSAGLGSVTSGTVTLPSTVGTATKLAVATSPSNGTSGIAFTTQPVVQVQDANGALVSTSTAAVTASVATGTGTLSGTTTVNAVNGVATFTDLRINGSGLHTLRFTNPGLTSATSSSFSVTGTATKLTITTQPSSVVQNTVAFPQQPVIQLRDASNNAVAQAGVVVTASIASGGGSLGGTLTATTDASGKATFTNLAITGSAGSRTVRFSATSLTGITSTAVNVTAGPATQLGVTTQPSASTQSGVAFAQQPVVQVRDVSGNAVSQGGIVVTASIASGGGTLNGSPTATTSSSGSATFTDLSITGTPGSRTLSFAATSLTGTTSNAFVISAPASQIATNDGDGQSAVRGTLVATPPSVIVRDQFGNPVSGVSVTFAVTGGGGSITGANPTSDANGVARVGSWRLGSTATNNSLSATSAGLTGSPVTFTATGTAPSAVSTFYNSTEPGCDGSDANVLWCDDFERGYWFVSTADKANPQNAGWNGTPYGSNDPQGLNFGRCSGAGVAGTSCAATNGGHTGGIGQARAMGDHDLNGATNEIYFRYYVKPLPGYSFGQEKALTFNKDPAGVGGIYFGTMFFGLGSGQSSIQPTFLEVNNDQNRSQNMGNGISLTGGNWYYIELHLKLNTSGSDVLEMWIDNCGPAGTGCTGTPTLRMRHTNMKLRPTGDNSSLFRSIWLENWANPPALGEMYYDQIKVSRTGPIGFKP